MTDAKLLDRAPRVGRFGTVAAWISAVCCLPYLVLKVVWTVGMPLGITDRSLLHSDGWVAANALMALMQLAGLLLVLALRSGMDASEAGWSLADTVLVIKVVIGVLAAAVGVLAVIAAAKDKRRPAAATPPRPKIADSGATRLKEIA